MSRIGLTSSVIYLVEGPKDGMLLVFALDVFNLHCFCSQSAINKPADDAPDDDHVEINDILGLRRATSGCWEWRYRMESTSGNYEDLIGWADLETVFSDFEPADGEPLPDTEENLVVLFLNKQKKKSHKGAAKVIADLRKVDLCDLFPFLGEKELPGKSAVEEIPVTCEMCTHDDYTLGSYHMVDFKFAVLEDNRKHSEAKCLG